MLDQHLKNYFGFDAFLTGQRTVIEKIMSGRSAAAIFPTGAGKSICYQLPAMLLPGMTLVVSPLLSLMKDQQDFLQQKEIPAARLDSTLEPSEYNAVLEQAKRGDLKILMISVERFRNERFRFHLGKMDVALMVIDEAHCISEWGHNFRPEYLQLPGYRTEFNIDQALLLTATATGRVIDDMCAKFDLLKEDVCVTGFYRDNLHLKVTPVATSEKDGHLLQRIQEAPGAPTIVYVTRQKTAEAVAEFIGRHGIAARSYHAGMQTVERERIQNEFMHGKLACVVATIAFGMGIDKKDIRRVIHYDLPKSIENYSQEIGRSGRDGEPALCEVLANRDNMHVLEYFEEKGWIELQARQSVDVYDILTRRFNTGDVAHKMHSLFKEKERHDIQRIHAVVDFFESDVCLSRQLAGYFGERLDMERCGHCSVCKGGKAVLHLTTALKPLSTFDYETLTEDFMQAAGGQSGIRNLTKFLCGIYTPDFSKLKVKAMPNFGVLKDYPFSKVMKWVEDNA